MLKATLHFKKMLKERNIKLEWINEVLELPEIIEKKNDGTTHYIKKIEEYGNRWLRVIINEAEEPNKIITAFFDRRLRRRKNENNF